MMGTRAEQIREMWAAAWNQGEVDALDQLLTADYRRHSSTGSGTQDLAGLKASIEASREAFPDLVTTIDDLIIEGDVAAVRWHSTGTHQHPFLGVPATNRTIEISGATFAHFDGDRIAEEFVTWDPRSSLAALGIITVGQD